MNAATAAESSSPTLGRGDWLGRAPRSPPRSSRTPLVLLLALVVALSSPFLAGTVGSADGIPAVYAPMYEAAATAYTSTPMSSRAA